MVSRGLDNIYPEMVDLKMVKLIYILDYVAYFYQYLAKKTNYSITHLGGSCSIESNIKLWKLCIRLNTILKNILQYSLDTYNCNFFYESSSANISDELYFHKVFKRCIERLHVAELVIKQVNNYQ